MNRDKELRDLLQSVIPPLKEAELRQDLWPRMTQALERRPTRLRWFEWALAAAALAWLLVFPEAIPALLYQI